MDDGEKDKQNQPFDGALMGKLSVRLGKLEFSGEAQQAFLDAQFQRFVAAIPAGAIEAEEVEKPASGGAGEVPAGKFTASLASHIKARAAEGNQNRRFLATADWLRLRGMDTITVAAVSKALIDNHQSRLANSGVCLNRNVAKGFCEKISNGFYITPEGLKELGYS